MYVATKRYGPEEGFAVAYRQWRADRKNGGTPGTPYPTHEIPGCCAIHGYALSFYFEFECEELDSRNWVTDFGSFKTFKTFLKETFDHTFLLAIDDPKHDFLVQLHEMGLAKIVEVEATGCEALSKFLFDYLNEIWLAENYPTSEGKLPIRCRKVEVRETPSNSAWYEE